MTLPADDWKEWVDLAIAAQVGPLLARLDGMDTALVLGRETLTSRLEHANGLIAQMREKERDFARQETVTELGRRIEQLEQYRSSLEGDTLGSRRGSQPLTLVAMMFVGAAIASAVSYLAARIAG